jgi:hypothetical protein
MRQLKEGKDFYYKGAAVVVMVAGIARLTIAMCRM